MFILFCSFVQTREKRVWEIERKRAVIGKYNAHFFVSTLTKTYSEWKYEKNVKFVKKTIQYEFDKHLKFNTWIYIKCSKTFRIQNCSRTFSEYSLIYPDFPVSFQFHVIIIVMIRA